MSQKLSCPGCGVHASDIYRAVMHDGEPCPGCGLPAATILEVDSVRRSRADTALQERLAEALVDAGREKARADKLQRVVDDLRDALDRLEHP